MATEAGQLLLPLTPDQDADYVFLRYDRLRLFGKLASNRGGTFGGGMREQKTSDAHPTKARKRERDVHILEKQGIYWSSSSQGKSKIPREL